MDIRCAAVVDFRPRHCFYCRFPALTVFSIVGFRPSPSFLLSVSRCGRSSARHFIRGEKFDPTQHAEGDAKKKKKKGGVDDEGSYNEHKGAHTEWVKERSAQTGDEGFRV